MWIASGQKLMLLEVSFGKGVDWCLQASADLTWYGWELGTFHLQCIHILYA